MGLVLNGAIKEMNNLIPVEGIGERDSLVVLSGVQDVIKRLLGQIFDETNEDQKEEELVSLNCFTYFLEIYIERLAKDHSSLVFDILKLATLYLLESKVKFHWPKGRVKFLKERYPRDLKGEGHTLVIGGEEHEVISSASMRYDVYFDDTCLASYYLAYLSFISDEIDADKNLIEMILPSVLDAETNLCTEDDGFFNENLFLKPFVEEFRGEYLDEGYIFAMQRIPCEDDVISLNLIYSDVRLNVNSGFIPEDSETAAKVLMGIEKILGVCVDQ